MAGKAGGCLCGNIRYTLKQEPSNMTVCHCSHCQKVTGSAFSTNAIIPRSDIEFSGGELASYNDKPESGNVLKRSFCPKCGSSLMSESSGRPGFVVLKLGSLDDVSAVNPATEIWTRSAQPWVKFATTMTSFDKARH